jgi:hypothetical protein
MLRSARFGANQPRRGALRGCGERDGDPAKSAQSCAGGGTANEYGGAAPVSGACWQPYFKGHTMMVNGNYNGWRLEGAWLDK